MKKLILFLLLVSPSYADVFDSSGRNKVNSAITTSEGFVSTSNSSTTPLGISGVFTGTGEEIKNYAAVTVNVFADVASATNGLSFQWSSDNTNWDHVETYDVPAGVGRAFNITIRARYFRVVYTNGGTGQTTFRLQTILQPVLPAPRKEPMDVQVDNDEAAVFTRSAIVGKTTAGGGAFIDVKVTPSGTLTVDPGTVTVTDGAGALNVIVDSGTIGTITNPVTVTDGVGALNVIVDSGTITADTESPSAAALGDSAGNPTTGVWGAFLQLFNGTTWDRARGDITNGLDVDVTRVPTNQTIDLNRISGSALGATNPVPVRQTDGTSFYDSRNIQGQNSARPIYCSESAFLNMTTATTTQLVALTASQIIYVCSYAFEAAGATNAKLVYGTGTNCATGTTDATPTWEWTAQTGINRNSGGGNIVTKTAVSNAICASSSAAVNLKVEISYTKF